MGGREGRESRVEKREAKEGNTGEKENRWTEKGEGTVIE